MLENIDLSRQVAKKDFKAVRKDLESRLSAAQRRVRELNIPVIVLFEGWDAAGKGTLINSLILPLDPRGFNVHNIMPPNEEEATRPFLWRFWDRIPPRGRVAVFDNSWYQAVWERLASKKAAPRKDAEALAGDVAAFERQLVNDGYLIVKFFTHISKKTQKRRVEKLQSNAATAWRAREAVLKRHRRYGDYLEAANNMLGLTESDVAPWTIVESEDRYFATQKVMTTVLAALETAGVAGAAGAAKKTVAPSPAISVPKAAQTECLGKVDLTLSVDRETYEEQLKKKQKRFRELEYEIYTRRVPVVIAFEGWDAAGKGGNIKRLTANLDPRGYEVIPIGVPTDEEKARHYLWRFWRHFPKGGHIAVFDRTWYGRTLVERVEGFCSEAEWRRAYREINEMEKHWADFGTVIVKFWLHIDKDEQLRRFKERESVDYKKWKITDEDWRNREKWDLYQPAVEETLCRCGTPNAPWTVVESECKLYARLKTLDTVIQAIEAKL